ncbi:MAG: HAD family hydrolase [Halobacteriaceae archaeon]
MTDALLFDMDGVLLRGRQTDRSIYETAARVVLRELGADPDAALVDALVEPGDVSVVRHHCGRAGVDPERAWRRREVVAHELAADAIRAGRRSPYPDVDALHDVDRPTGIVSNNRHATVQFVADHFDLPARVVRGRDPTLRGYERLKPDPHYLETTLADLGVDDAVYVGDRHTDVVAADRAGLDAVLLERPDTDPGTPADVDPAARIAGLDELAGVA